LRRPSREEAASSDAEVAIFRNNFESPSEAVPTAPAALLAARGADLGQIHVKRTICGRIVPMGLAELSAALRQSVVSLRVPPPDDV
jgi:hypothetical protein